MTSRTLAFVGMFGLACGAALAQTASTTGTTDTTGSGTSTALGDNTPSKNVTGGALQARSPGLITAAARAAHTAVVSSLRSRVSSTPPPDDNGSGTSGTGTTDLANLLGQLAGSGVLGSLSGQFGTSGLTSTATNPNTTGTVNNSSSGTSTLPPEVLALLQAAGIDPNTLPSTSSSSGTTSGTGTTGTGTIPATMIGNNAARSANLTGSPDTAQSTTGTTDTTTTEPSFRVRWLNAVLTTVFTGITVGLQSQPFIEYLKDRLRPPTTSLLMPSDVERQILASHDHGGGGCRHCQFMVC